MSNDDVVMFGLAAACGLLAMLCAGLKIKIDEQNDTLKTLIKRLRKLEEHHGKR